MSLLHEYSSRAEMCMGLVKKGGKTDLMTEFYPVCGPWLVKSLAIKIQQIYWKGILADTLTFSKHFLNSLWNTFFLENIFKECIVITVLSSILNDNNQNSRNMHLKNRWEQDKNSTAAITFCKELCCGTQWNFLLCMRFIECMQSPWLRAWHKHLALLLGQIKWLWKMLFSETLQLKI